MEMTSSPSNSPHFSPNSSPQSQDFEFQIPSTSNNTHPTILQRQIPTLHLTLRRDILLYHDTAAAAATAPVENTKQPLKKDGNNLPQGPSPVCTVKSLDHVDLVLSNNFTLDFSRESCEMDLDDCLFEFIGFINNHPTKRPWSKKRKLIKNSILVQKLKFFFNKSASTDHESPAKANPNPEPQNTPKTDEFSIKFTIFAKKRPFGLIGKDTYLTADAATKISADKGIEENVISKSISAAKNPVSPVEFLPSSTSSSSSLELKRSSSATEIEGSIEAAIDHSMNSQQILDKFLDCYCIDL